jgi:uncharacterized damage-inducible protein DinB
MEITSIGPFLSYFEKVRERTMRVIGCIPPERLEWSYGPGKFTLGDLARHIATTERYVFAECAAGRNNAYPGCGRELADSYEKVVAFVAQLHRESVAMFAQLSDADLQRKCESADGSPMTTWKLLRAMVEHEIHHRGELYAALGALGVSTPPLYGLSSEQLRTIAAGRE